MSRLGQQIVDDFFLECAAMNPRDRRAMGIAAAGDIFRYKGRYYLLVDKNLNAQNYYPDFVRCDRAGKPKKNAKIVNLPWLEIKSVD